MDNVKVEFNIGPIGEDHEITGSYECTIPCDEPRFIIMALKKSLAKLKLDKEKIIVGILNVFVNGINEYEVGFFKAGNLSKIDIRKL